MQERLRISERTKAGLQRASLEEQGRHSDRIDGMKLETIIQKRGVSIVANSIGLTLIP